MMPKSAKPTSADDERGDVERAAAEEPERDHRIGLARLPDHEGDEQRRPPRPGSRASGPTSSCARSSDQRPDEREQAGGDEHRAHDVERRAVGSRDSSTAQSVAAAAIMPIGTLIQKTADQLDVLDQEAAEQRAEGEAEARDAGPDADRRRQLLARERGDDDRERERVHERRADALDDARGDQALCRRRERTGRRREGEDGEADEEHALAAEAVAELAAEQDQRGEREDVGVDRPLEVLRRRLSSRWIDGSATFTTVLSSMIMKSAKHMAESVHHLWFARRVGLHSSVRPLDRCQEIDERVEVTREARQRALAFDRAHEARRLREAEEQHRDRLGRGVCADPPARLRQLDAARTLPCQAASIAVTLARSLVDRARARGREGAPAVELGLARVSREAAREAARRRRGSRSRPR